MKRLTIRNSDGSVSQPMDLRWDEALKRLAAYEDTGLEPDEITDFLPTLKEWRQNMGALRHVHELVTAEAEGRLLVLPCKVGDTVYVIKGGDVLEVFVVSFHWHEWQDRFDMGLLFDHRKTNGIYNYPVENWGKTVFRTREEAEKALEREV